MGILTYVKIGAAVVIIAVLGYFVWNYQHMTGKIVKLEEKIAGLELRAEVIEKAQKATDSYVKARDQRVKKNVQDNANINKMVEVEDDTAMRTLFIERGLLGPQASPAPGGGKGGAGNLPGR